MTQVSSGQVRGWEGLVAALCLLALGAVGCDECVAGSCEPCVGETCEVTCVAPNDEDVAYVCLWPCTEGADCKLACERVDCNLDCSGSTCACENCDAHCTAGADCHLSGHARLGCEGATCDAQCSVEKFNLFAQCELACVGGSTCSMTCGDPTGVRSEGHCAMSCDDTSSCHLACHGECSLCCNGSTDCALDCPDSGTTCDDGRLVCGTSCDTLVAGLEACPAYDPSWLQQ